MPVTGLIRAAIAATLIAAPQVASAQAFHVAVGPALRTLSVERIYAPPRAWDAISLDASWTARMSPRLRLLFGGGVAAGPSVTEEYSSPVPDAPSFAPCLPDVHCPPPSARTVVSGNLLHVRLGLAFEEDWVFVGGGVLAGRSNAGETKSGYGTFVELRLRPFIRLRQLSLGVMALQATPAPGSQRALVTPTVGLRF